MDHIAHALGLLSQAVIIGAATASAATIARMVQPARHRILAALRGEPISPAASGEPHPPALPQRRGVEAAAAPAIQVRR